VNSRQPICRFEVFADVAHIERTVEAKRPRERTTPLSQLEAVQVGMQVRTSTVTLTSRIGNDATCNACHDHHETDQIGLGRPGFTPNARALR
jgi:hypothetical protein